ncbi:M56 family metallopeptidase [Spirosoma sp. BT702]|uniref:M56 family metallopeptidase n=1 Tax=Spirosoma profusum TaxID=2771354 RepID=A0A926XUN1_9BACT|nr:M56 family metallopeptidase [Spirosoma profusum]MBD2699886.1 M56 family metallopeptidase [Spirosoma profusum]
MSTFAYLLTVSLYLLLFYGCYVLLLRRNTFFGLNRAYLLGSIGLSLVLPFVKLPATLSDTLPTGVITLPAFVVNSGGHSGATYALTVTQWLWLFYGLGVLIMLVRMIIHLRAVMHLINRGNAERKPNYTLVRLTNNVTPSFSFGTYLVLNQADSNSEPDALLRHEEAHIRQCHTTDVLFLEIIQTIFWFNPILVFYKKSLQEVHEFLADRAVLQTPQPDYPRQLVAYALNVTPAALTTSFASKSTLKQRIIMLQKPASHRRALFGYALVLPLAAGLLMCTQSDRDQPQSAVITPENATRKSVKVEGEIFTVVEQQPAFPGGMAKLGEYLGANLKYPAAAEKANVEGKVYLNFVVTKTGEITDVQLLKGIGFGADEEAIRVLSQMPNWIPGRQNGKAVNTRYNIPIWFQLDEETKDAAFKQLGPPPPPPPPPGENGKESTFFSVPTDDETIQRSFAHFIVDDKEVAFQEFQKYDKAAIVEASSSDQTIRIATR